MKRRLAGALLVLALPVMAAVVAGCGRHVVLDPDTVDRLNDRGWTVKSQPRPVSVVYVDGGAP